MPDTHLSNDGLVVPEQDLSAVSTSSSDDNRLYRHNGAAAITLHDGSTTSDAGYYSWDDTNNGWRRVEPDAQTLQGNTPGDFAGSSHDNSAHSTNYATDNHGNEAHSETYGGLSSNESPTGVWNYQNGLQSEGNDVLTTADGGGGGGMELINVVDDHGAAGDGSTDDSTAIQSAVNEAETNGQGVVYFPPGEYVIGSQIVVSGDNIVFLGHRGASVLNPTSLGGSTYCVDVSGTDQANYGISAASEGDLTVTTSTASDAGNFSAGQVVKITSDDAYEGSATLQGEMRTVASVDSGTGEISLRGPVQGEYSTSPAVHDIDAIQEFTWDGLGVAYDDKAASYRGPIFRRTHGLNVKNCRLTNCYERGITASDAYQTLVDNVTVIGSDQDGAGYGINLSRGTTDATVRDSYFDQTRHSVAMSGANNPGVQRDILVKNCTCKQPDTGYNYALDTHSETEDVTFKDNTLHGCGVQVRGQNITAINNEILHPSAAGFRVWQPDNNIIHDFECKDNHVVMSPNSSDKYGVYIVGDHAVIDANVSDNHLEGDGNGVGILVSTAAEGSNFDENRIDNFSTGIRLRDFGTIPSGVTRQLNSTDDNVITNFSDGIYWGGSNVYDYCTCADNVFDTSADPPIYEWGLNSTGKFSHNINFGNHDT